MALTKQNYEKFRHIFQPTGDENRVLTGTFFWVTTQIESLPLTPIEVTPAAFTALNAYSFRPNQLHKKKRKQILEGANKPFSEQIIKLL